MAVREKYRYNSSLKEYQIISDFSKGVNTRLADSIMGDNQARVISNFTLEAGAVLAKRKGYHALDIKDELLHVLDLTEAELKVIETIKSFKFKRGTQDIISSYVIIKGKPTMVNFIFDGNAKIPTITKLEFDLKDNSTVGLPIISSFGEKTHLLMKEKYNDVEGKEKINSLFLFWEEVAHNWVSVPTIKNLKGKSTLSDKTDFYYTMENKTRQSIYKTIIVGPGASKDKSNLKGNVETLGLKTESGGTGDQIIVKTVSPTWEGKSYKSNLYSELKVDQLRMLNIGVDLIMGSMVHLKNLPKGSTNVYTDDEINMFYDRYSKGYDMSKSGFGEGIVGRPLRMFDDSAGKNGHDLVWNAIPHKVASISTQDWNDYLMEIMRGNYLLKFEFSVGTRNDQWPDAHIDSDLDISLMVFSETDSKWVTVAQEKRALKAPFNVNPSVTAIFDSENLYKNANRKIDTTNLGRQSYGVSQSEPTPMDLYWSQLDLESVTLTKLFNFSEVLKPDVNTFSLFSYNMLNVLDVNSLDIIDSTKYTDYISLPQVGSLAPTLSKPIILNSLLPVVGKQLELVVPINKDKDDYFFSYSFLPLEEWTQIQARYESASEYIDNVVKPAFDGRTKGDNEISFTPFDTTQYICIVRATKIDPTTLTKSHEYLESTLNINPIGDEASSLNFTELKSNFFLTNKGISFKNQWFLYGGSNTIFVSDVNNFGYFPITNFVKVPTSQEIISIVPFYNQLLVQTNTNQYTLTGSTPSNFKLVEVNNDIGVIADKTPKPIKNFIMSLSSEGVYVTKSTFNFADRFNIDRVDLNIDGEITPTPDSSAIVNQDKYIIHDPVAKNIWVYYNDFKAWVSHTSPLFEFENIHKLILEEKVLYMGKLGLNIFVESDNGVDIPNITNYSSTTEEEYTDKDMYGNKHVVESRYKSKEVDFGLPNHDKKFKEVHVSFEDTPDRNAIFMNGWVDGKQTIKYWSENALVANGAVHRITTEINQIETEATAIYGVGSYNKSLWDDDANQVHKVIISGRGKSFQFEILHKEDKRIKVKNFGIVLKNKKPRARYKTSS